MQTNHINIKFFLILFLGLAFFLLSCQKYLDQKPDKRLTVPDTLEDLLGLFNDADYMNIGTTPSYGEGSSDNSFMTQATFDNSITQEQEMYTWTLKEYMGSSNDWSTNYLTVFNANFALETLTKIERNAGNAGEWDQVKGYALFFRAHTFLNLAWNYAKAYEDNSANTNPGIVLRMTSDFNVPSKRASVAETYKQIISDARESITYLPDLPSNLFLPSKAAAYGLLARAFLSMRIYDSALNYSTLSLSLKNDLLDYNELTLTANAPFPRLNNKETIFYTEMSTYVTNHYSFTGYVDTALVDQYQENDLRKTGFFRLEGQYHRFKGGYTASNVALFSGIAVDEMLLTQAECYARKNRISEAMNALNTLYKMRWSNVVEYPGINAANQEDALDKVLAERRKELLMRGLRWMDIKRLNLEGRDIVLTRLINGEYITLPPNDNRYALRIPLDIIEITGMAQNEY